MKQPGNSESGSSVIQSCTFVKAFRKTVSVPAMTTTQSPVNIGDRGRYNYSRTAGDVTMTSTQDETEGDK